MRIVFFGTSRFAAIILKSLLEHSVDVVAVVTRTDKPQGRSLKVAPPPVKLLITETYPHIPLLQPVKASTPEFVEQLKAYAPDLFIVAAYGEIMKSMLLDLPRHGAINVHGSLLPKYRGAAPIQRALMNGDRETGVTIMRMVLEMDAGDILEPVKIEISPEMNFGQLEEKLAEIATPALIRVINQVEAGSLQPSPQNPEDATYAPKITSQESLINWKLPAEQIHNLIRALAPQPGAWCWVEIGGEKKRLKIRQSMVVPPYYENRKEFLVECGEGASKSRLKLQEVQLEGKKSMTGEQFLLGNGAICKII